MSFVISLGSNMGNRIEHIDNARLHLSKKFELEEASQLYESSAVDYENQSDFINQVLVFKRPEGLAPTEVLEITQEIENSMGRVRSIPKGPRIIDIDILFWDSLRIHTERLIIPHPEVFRRSFIILPLKELDYFNALENMFEFPSTFCNEAFPFKP